MITDFGKELRKYRIDRTQTLRDMAEGIGMSAAYLSSVESGKKNITDNLVELVITFLSLDKIQASNLQNVAAVSRGEVSINLEGVSDIQKNSAVMFARRLNQLDIEQLIEINKILDGGVTDGK